LICALNYIAAVSATLLALVGIIRGRRAFANWVFAVGMLVLAAEAFLNGLSCQAIFPSGAAAWQVWRLRVAALVPGLWLAFSLSFTTRDHGFFGSIFKWAIAAFTLVLLVLVVPFAGAVFTGEAGLLTYSWVLGLGWSGYWFHLLTLLGMILILVVLERILRESVGRKRWQVKFFVLGVGAVIGARLIVSSFNLIYHRLNLELEFISSAALIAAFPLILTALKRTGGLQLDIYLSQKTLFNSITLIVVGVYFMAIGLASHLLQSALPFPVRVLLVFVSLLALVIAFYSDRLRLRLKAFVSGTLSSARHDYRQIWLTFARRTAAIVEEKALCEAVAKMVSEMFDALSVSFWLMGDQRRGLACRGSTVCSESEARSLPLSKELVTGLQDLLRAGEDLVDLEAPAKGGQAAFAPTHRDFFKKAHIRYLLPISAAGSPLGFITIGDRVGGRPLTFEDTNILVTIANQVGASLLNIKLGEQLRRSKELEAFQAVSAFFVHDLKNLGSKLSMMFQNLPGNFDNPEFREDAIRLMAKSVEKINTICSRLSSLREKLEIHPAATDLNGLVRQTLDGFGASLKGRLISELQSLPPVMADSEQIPKVLTNLILNAVDAAGADGKIWVNTARVNGWATLSVKDNGCGIPRQFLEEHLFRPFQTTKKQGTGIGLFQSKMIVEGHGGKIEVESVEGQGSVFRVFLPITKEKG
jgi:putative PEP-CTERM system histidine kinase